MAVFYKTTEEKITASLIEVLYHNITDDELLLFDGGFHTIAGFGIAKAIENFIELKNKRGSK